MLTTTNHQQQFNTSTAIQHIKSNSRYEQRVNSDSQQPLVNASSKREKTIVNSKLNMEIVRDSNLTLTPLYAQHTKSTNNKYY